jgi:hypothetical protein
MVFTQKKNNGFPFWPAAVYPYQIPCVIEPEGTMMRYVLFSIQAVAILFATNAFAQECYLSTECDGDAICVNKVCAMPEVQQATCDSNDDCEWTYFCESDVCKPDGVACQNDDGFGIENVTFGLAACSVGSNSQWMADMECMPGTDGCDIPSLEQMTTAELEDEYQDCMTHLTDACDIDVPEPEDVCDSDLLDVCTDYVTLIEDFQSVCSEERVMGGGDDAVQVSNLYAFPRFQGLSGDKTDYQIVLCCEEFGDDSQKDDIEAASDCMDGLSADDCDGVWDCMDRAPNGDDSYGADDEGEQNEKGGSASRGDSNSGCSLVNPGSPVGSLFELLLI